MGYWEPIATPGSHLEPPDPVEWVCDVCEQDEQDCECHSCEECGEYGPATKISVDDEFWWVCDEHKATT